MSKKNKKIKEQIDDTKEINLDELYDGSINNTVLIDPVTNSEILVDNKKSGVFAIFILIIITGLLVSYFVKMKTPIGNTTKAVVPATTTTIITTTNSYVEPIHSGTLICNYSYKTEKEEQNASLKAIYVDSKITNTTFNLDVISLTESESEIILSLKNEYENLYINNASISGNVISFVKNEKGFNFKVNTDYEVINFDSLSFEEGKANLFIKPSLNDTYNSLKQLYEAKEYKCNIDNNIAE